MNPTRSRGRNEGRNPKEPLTKKTLEKMKERERKVAKKSKSIKSKRVRTSKTNIVMKNIVATTALPEYQQVHAVFLATMGKANMQEVAKSVGVTTAKITSWKKKYNWEEELRRMIEASEKAIHNALMDEGKRNGMLYQVTPEQLRNVFAEMTGKQIELSISELVSEIFVEDLKDLAKINKRIRFWLDAKRDDGSEYVIMPEVLKDIAQTKVTVIKAVRLLFGLDTDSVKKAGDVVMGDKIIEVLVQGPAANSLLQIGEDLKIIDAEIKDL